MRCTLVNTVRCTLVNTVLRTRSIPCSARGQYCAPHAVNTVLPYEPVDSATHPPGVPGTLRRCDQSSSPRSAASGAIQVGSIYHVVGTYDGTTERLYINGVQVTSAALTGAITTSSNSLTIGSGGAAGYFAGTIDDVAVYGTALSAARVASHYTAGN